MITMKEKEKKIIEVGISLFAKKGYSATSIQEIVDACGMSKGAFYLYFKSKEALMLAAFKYQFQSIQARMDSLYLKNLSPRETFIAQLEAQLEEIDKNKEFIIMQIREQAIPLNSEIEGFIRKISHEIGHFYHTSLLAIYGDKVGKYVFDLNMILQGIVNSYVKQLWTYVN
jgi:AcrR family transcriptional regulator